MCVRVCEREREKERERERERERQRGHDMCEVVVGFAECLYTNMCVSVCACVILICTHEM